MKTSQRFQWASVSVPMATLALTCCLISCCLFFGATNSSAENSTTDTAATVETKDPPYTAKTEEELRRSLSRIQFKVTQEEGTETAFRNLYWNNKKPGVYNCVVCDRALFKSETKYKSGTGWPSFFAPIDQKVVGTRIDNYLIYARTEVHCSRCNAHLGHVFNDGPKPTGKRYCMNSASLKFVDQKELEKQQPPAAPAESAPQQ